jgi:hypothetical protein
MLLTFNPSFVGLNIILLSSVTLVIPELFGWYGMLFWVLVFIVTLSTVLYNLNPFGSRIIGYILG